MDLRRAAATLLAIAAMTGAGFASGAAAPRASALEARLSEALAARRVAPAKAIADSLLQMRRRRGPPRPLEAASYLDTLGIRFFGTGSPEGRQVALRYFERALATREGVFGPDQVEVAESLGPIAQIYDYEGRWADALPIEQRALAIRLRRQGGHHPAVAASRRQVGLALFQLGRYAESESMLAASIATYDSLGAGDYPAEVADGLNNMGEVSRVQDRFDQAAGYFERGLAFARENLPDHDTRLVALRNNLAGLYKDQGRYAEAEPLMRQSLAQVERSPSPDPEALATVNLNMAEIYRNQDRLDEAEPLYAKALEMARTLLPPGSPDLMPFISQTAVVDQALGRIEQAEPLYREAQALGERTLGAGHPLVAQTLHDLGQLFAEHGRHREAEESFRRALAIRVAVFGDRHPEAATTRVALARALADDPAAGDTAARPMVEQALAVLDAAPAYPEARLDAHALRAEIRARTGDRAGALADMEVALSAVDSLRAQRGGGDEARGALVRRHLDLYHRVVAWRLAAGNVAGALEAHERARARILLDQLTAGAVNLRSGIPANVRAPLEARERAARQRLAEVQRKLQEASMRFDLEARDRLELITRQQAARDSAATELQRALAAIKEASPLWRDVLNAGGRTAPLATLQRELVDRDELLLVYHVGGSGSWLFVVPPAGEAPRAYALELDSTAARSLRVTPGVLTADKLESIVAGDPSNPGFGATAPVSALLALAGEDQRSTRARRAPGEPGLLERRLEALGPALMPAAAWQRVRRAAQVIVVPDGALHLLPFEALIMRARSGSRPPEYWLDDGPAIRYATSATSLLSLTRRPRAAEGSTTGPRLLSVTNPAFASAGAGGDTARQWAALPGTERETQAIARAFAPESITVIEGRAAGEARVRALLPGRRLVHFATHGFVTETGSDLLAGLALAAPDNRAAPRSEDDGLLQLYEIYELPLSCDLAVLSACETQRGRRVAGEGVFALSRGFLAAGSRRVVASLWSVQDESTALLMGDFFARLSRAGKGRRMPDYAAALRDARRDLRRMKGRDDPFYWAPFTITGVR